jgi:methionyl-tRNA synthetase
MMKVVDKMLLWENGGRIDLLKVNYPLRAPELLFRKIEDTEVAAQVEKLHTKGTKPSSTTAAAPKESKKMEQSSNTAIPPSAAEAPAKEAKAIINFDDFAKIDLRAGTILTADKVEKADKLLKLSIDLGEEAPRTIVSGIALHYAPEDIVGKQVTVVANLAPRKMRGIESAGMILMAEDADGKLVFVSPLQAVGAGADVK